MNHEFQDQEVFKGWLNIDRTNFLINFFEEKLKYQKEIKNEITNQNNEIIPSVQSNAKTQKIHINNHLNNMNNVPIRIDTDQEKIDKFKQRFWGKYSCSN